MRRFSISVEIPAPPATVWKAMSDVERWHEWTPSITRVKLLTRGPLAVGSRALIRQPKLPPAFWKVTAIEPGRHFTWVSAGPGMRVVGHHSVEATAQGTRATLSLDFQGPFGGLLGRLTRSINDRYLAFEAAGLKARSLDPAFHHDIVKV